mgnify:CR=1 FL=1
MQCPSISNNPLEVCSGNGVCNCNTGECKCNSACYIDDRCSVEMSCGGHGNCFEGGFRPVCWRRSVSCTTSHPLTTVCAPGICNCHVCYSPPDCAGDNVCSSHGTCAEGMYGFPCLWKQRRWVCVCVCDRAISPCLPGSPDGDTAQCHCQGCYGGFNCEIEETCNGNGACVTVRGTPHAMLAPVLSLTYVCVFVADFVCFCLFFVSVCCLFWLDDAFCS